MFNNEKISIEKLFHYINSVYQISEKVKKIFDTRKRISFKASKIVTIVLIGFILQLKSFNAMFNYGCNRKVFKKLIRGKVPKIDCARDLLAKIPTKQLTHILDSVVTTSYENKVLRNGTIDGYIVCAIDGVELFNSHLKSCDDCLVRSHRDGTVDYYHKAVVCMTVGSSPHIIIGEDTLRPRDGKNKDEGEQTGGKRLLERLYKTHHHFADIIVGDALYLNAPFINVVLKMKMDAVIRAKDTTRLILQDALGLIKSKKPDSSFRENAIDVEVWDESGFEMEGVAVLLRFLQFKEKRKDGEIRYVWIFTTSEVPAITLWRIIHRRWDIENNGFHQLKTYYNVKHCFVHKATENTFILNILAFNFRELYLFRRIKDFEKSKMTMTEVTQIFIMDLSNIVYRGFWDTS